MDTNGNRSDGVHSKNCNFESATKMAIVVMDTIMTRISKIRVNWQLIKKSRNLMGSEFLMMGTQD